MNLLICKTYQGEGNDEKTYCKQGINFNQVLSVICNYYNILYYNSRNMHTIL